MNLSLYSGATGMEAQQLSLNTISNNIANVNTTGFKKSKIEFQDLLYQNPQPVGGETGAGNIVPVGIEMGNGTKVTSTARVYSQGSLTQTERELDFAIDGNGFLEIERADGTSGYSRDGALKVGPNGEITTSDGLPVLNGPNNLPPDRVGIFVSPSGLVSVQLGDGTIQESGQIQLTRFSNPSGLKSIGGNLQIETAASGPPEAGNPNENGFGSIQQGYLEMSNVNVVEEMVNMIVAQRAYEINAKSIQTSDEMMGRVNQLKR
jgi:flagellar basal-body rod protein FlgG